MRQIAMLGIVAVALVSGCVLGAGESGPTAIEESTGEGRSAYDASLFNFTVYVPDDHRDSSGGAQRALATLRVVDTRGSVWSPDVFNCRVLVEMPIRHHSMGIITPQHAAEMSASAADAASSFVIHSRPKWISALFCPAFAGQIMRELNSLNVGARVFSL